MLKGQIALTATRPTTTTTGGGGGGGAVNFALHRSTSESSHTQNFSSNNAVDGDPSTYWESANNAFPQWLIVDLGATQSINRVVLKLPTPNWGARTQTLSVLGSTDGSNYSTIVGSTGVNFDPASNNVATLTFATTSTRYVRLNFTGNTGWAAGQLSEFEVYGP